MTLASARVNVGLSQKQASEKIGVTRQTLSSWERGLSVPPVDKVDSICEVYGVRYDNLNFLPQSSPKGN